MDLRGQSQATATRIGQYMLIYDPFITMGPSDGHTYHVQCARLFETICMAETNDVAKTCNAVDAQKTTCRPKINEVANKSHPENGPHG